MKRPFDSTTASSAERPDHPSSGPERKRPKSAQKKDKLLTSVAYISFPLKTYEEHKENKERRCAMEAIREAKQASADVINIAFARAVDINALWDDLKTEMESSVEQPAFSYRRQGPLITLFSENCGALVSEKNIDTEGGHVPSICLTFSGPAGRMTIIHAHWPPLPTKVRARILDEYFNAAEEKMESIRIIGGKLAPPRFLDSHMHKQGLNYLRSTTGDLCVLTQTLDVQQPRQRQSGHVFQDCFPLESSAAVGLMCQLWGPP